MFDGSRKRFIHMTFSQLENAPRFQAVRRQMEEDVGEIRRRIEARPQ